MKKILFSLLDKKMSERTLGSWEPTKFEITLIVPLWFGQSIIKLIKTQKSILRRDNDV